MPSNSDPAITRMRIAPPTTQLMSWPLRDEPVRTFFILGAELTLAVIAAYVSRHWGMGILVCSLLLPASWPLWLPVRFELGSKGIIRSLFGRRRRIAWTEFARYETHPHGVFLCHSSNHQPLAAIRGLFLPSRPPHTDLLPVLEYYLRPRAVEPISTQTQIP